MSSGIVNDRDHIYQLMDKCVHIAEGGTKVPMTNEHKDAFWFTCASSAKTRFTDSRIHEMINLRLKLGKDYYVIEGQTQSRPVSRPVSRPDDSKEIESLRKQLDERDSKITTLDSKIIDLRAQIRSYSSNERDLNLHLASREMEILRKSLAKSEAQYKDLLDKHSKSGISKLEEELAASKFELKSLRKRDDIHRETLAKVKAEIAGDPITALKQQLLFSKSKIEELEKSLESSKKENAELLNKILSKESEISALGKKIKEDDGIMKCMVYTIERNQGYMDRIEKQLDERNAQIAEMNKKLSASNVKELYKQISAQKCEISDLYEDTERLHSELLPNELEIARLGKLLDERNAKVSELNDQLSSSKESINDLDETVEQLKMELDEERHRNDYDSHFRAIEEELVKYTEEIRELLRKPNGRIAKVKPECNTFNISPEHKNMHRLRWIMDAIEAVIRKLRFAKHIP